MYTACTSDLEENFAMVLNSTTIQDKMNTSGVQRIYWNLNDPNNNNTLYAVQAKTNISSCTFAFGSVSSDDETVTYPLPPGSNTGSYSIREPTPRTVDWKQILLEISMLDRCDIPLSMFYISPNFSPSVVKMAKGILYDTERLYGPYNVRSCTVTMSCSLNLGWKQMQIFGNTPKEIKISEVTNFNNSMDNFDRLFSMNVQDYGKNGRIYGQRLTDSVIDKMSTALTVWRDAKYQGSNSSYNFLDEFDNIVSQSLVSSLQSMTNNISVNVDEGLLAPGIWIEIAILIIVMLLVFVILKCVLTTKNEKLLLPLSLMDFGIISTAIFREEKDQVKTSWPFELIKDKQDKHLVTANEINQY